MAHPKMGGAWLLVNVIVATFGQFVKLFMRKITGLHKGKNVFGRTFRVNNVNLQKKMALRLQHHLFLGKSLPASPADERPEDKAGQRPKQHAVGL